MAEASPSRRLCVYSGVKGEVALAQSARLNRKKLFGDPIMVSTIVVLLIFLALFILYPLAMLLINSVFVKGEGFTLSIFQRVLDMGRFRKAFTNTLALGFITGIGSTLLGLLFAYVDCYVNVRSRPVKRMFDVVSMLPVVSPPFVLSLSMILLFGRAGLVTRTLLGIYDSNIYGLHGIAIVQTLTFFPVCYLMLKGLLKNIDPSLEEASRNLGASRWKVFTTVTLPLLLPGLGNAFLVTFIESVADFANPMIIGGSFDTLATTIYLQVTGAYDKEGAAAMAVVLLSLTLILFLIQKYYLEKRTVATLTGKASRERMLIADKSVTVPLTVLCSVFSAFVILMYVSIPFGALFNLWGRDYSLTLKHFEYMFKYSGLKAFRDSFVLSLIASPITALLSMIISYLVVKKTFRLKGFIEFVSMLAMAVPGTVLGIGYIRGFANGLFGTGVMQGLYGTGAILVIVFIVRSLPVGTRSGISALQQIDKSIEESAYDLGANSGKVFMSVTLPLIKDSFFSGLVTTFVRSITAISAIILLVTPQYLLITTQINEFAEKGKYGVACAYATVLILIVYASILLMNLFIKYFGTSRKLKGGTTSG
ncbi:iron ABC transporter permease [Eubacteriales bacterium OttesenSCG-928-A19]|nr:iron ABC transporter permease [Eubacteriales bacterium OttesenSCG-928-A19]